MHLARQDAGDHFQINLRPFRAHPLDDFGAVLGEILAQGREKLFVELVAVADRAAVRIPALPRLPGRRQWLGVAHRMISSNRSASSLGSRYLVGILDTGVRTTSRARA